jgi:hypothetical protein
LYYSQSQPLAEETSSGGRVRDLDDRYDQRIRTRPTNSTIHSLHSPTLTDARLASRRPPIGRRIFRALTRFFIAVLIGVGATLAWQSYGDAAREMLVARLPTLAWLFSVSKTSPVVAATPADPMPKLESLASTLDYVRRSVEQLAARQQEMAQNIAALRAAENDIRQQVSSMPPSPSQQPASISPPKPQQARAQPSAVQPSSVSRPTSPAGPVLLSR